MAAWRFCGQNWPTQRLSVVHDLGSRKDAKTATQESGKTRGVGNAGAALPERFAPNLKLTVVDFVFNLLHQTQCLAIRRVVRLHPDRFAPQA